MGKTILCFAWLNKLSLLMEDTPLKLLTWVFSLPITKAAFSLKCLHAPTKGGTRKLPLQGEIHNCLSDAEIVSR